MLPKNWIWATIGAIAQSMKNGIYKPPEFYNEKGIACLRMYNIEDGKIVWKDIKRMNLSKDELKEYELITDDILVNRVNSRELVGKAATIPHGLEPCVYESKNIRLRLYNDFINSKLVTFWFLLCGQRYFSNNAQQTVGMASINQIQLGAMPIPLMSIEEQKRIVSKLEELFTKLDAGIEYVKKNQILLKQYRQSILKHVFEGKLTEKWRKEHKNELELSSNLEKIIIYKNHSEIEEIERSAKIYDIYEFPKEWTWIRIKNIAEKIQYGSSEKAIGDSNGIPVLRMGNIYEGKINYDNLKYYPSDWSHLTEFLLQDGDVLFNRTNSAELVGKTAVYQSQYPKSVFASYLIRIKILKNYYNPMILSYFINSTYGRKFIKSVVSQQVGQANVNGTKLSLMSIPLMSLLEQSRIVEEIEKRISIIENTLQIIESSIKYAMRLKSNILRNAFEGKLVQQDPSDESAQILLEKIQRERESTIAIRKEKSKIVKRKSIDNDSKQMRLM